MLASNAPGERIALQPEDRGEELVLYRLFSAIEPPDCWFTLDVGEYPNLDEDLAREAAENGPFAPGTRALVVIVPGGPEIDYEAASLEVPDEHRG